MDAADPQGPGWSTGRRAISAASGALAVAVGVALHAVAAYYRPEGDHPLDADSDWAFLEAGWIRLAAWAAVAGGAWLLVWAWNGGRARSDPEG